MRVMRNILQLPRLQVSINGKKEISAIIVPTDAEGFTIMTIMKRWALMLQIRQNLSSIMFVCQKKTFLDTRRRFQQFPVTLDGGRIGIGAMAVGMHRRHLTVRLRYSKERKQFGKTFSEFQITQFKLADMAMKIELARNMVYKAAWLKDKGRPF